GVWADRHPSPPLLFLITGVAGVAIGILPYVSTPVLTLAIPALAQFNAELGLVSFVGVLILFAVPVTLLGCVPPFALRLAARDVQTVGATGGSLYALSTLGSILGIYLAVFWLIPTIGTRLTFLTFAVALLALAGFGLWRTRGAVYALPALAALCIVLGLGLVERNSQLKPLPNSIFETESAYNFIQVIQEDSLRLLTVNEGGAYQSVYVPGAVRLGGYWDLFLLAPALTASEPPQSLLIVGLAGGTVARQFAELYPKIRIDGIELDPE